MLNTLLPRPILKFPIFYLFFTLLITSSFDIKAEGEMREGYINKENNFELLMCAGLSQKGDAFLASDNWQINPKTGGQIYLFLNSNIVTYFNFDSIQVEFYKLDKSKQKSELCSFWLRTVKSKKPQVFPINFFNQGRYELMVYSNHKEYIGNRQFNVNYRQEAIKAKTSH